ncbi:MAG: ABC transporter ATP-binding protein [Rhodospirillales bacterium]
MTETAIAFRDVHHAFGAVSVLENIDLDVRDGEFVCVVGPSGCGKTTMLRFAAGLLTPKRGEVSFRGAAVTRPMPGVAVVFQDYSKALLPWRNAYGNVELALEAGGVPRRVRRERIFALLEMVGLGAHAESFPGQLSGGMQQRLQIARCLAQEPSVLLMDEPFGALDAMTRQTLQDEVLRIIADAGTTALFVTHDLDEAIYLGDRVVALYPNPGRIAQEFRIDLPRPRHQLSTREHPEFLRLRRTIFDFVRESHS